MSERPYTNHKEDISVRGVRHRQESAHFNLCFSFFSFFSVLGMTSSHPAGKAGALPPSQSPALLPIDLMTVLLLPLPKSKSLKIKK